MLFEFLLLQQRVAKILIQPFKLLYLQQKSDTLLWQIFAEKTDEETKFDSFDEDFFPLKVLGKKKQFPKICLTIEE